MRYLSPSILSADFGHLAQQLQQLNDLGVHMIHFDVMDGQFVSSISYGLPVLKSIRKYIDKPFDVHLMIVEPSRYVKEFVEVGADIITVHAEACKDLRSTILQIKSLGAKAGVAIKPETSVSVIEPVLDIVDMVLVMTVNPGFGGQKLMPETLSKISTVSELIKSRGLSVKVEVDGGVCQDTIDPVIEAGADIIVVGSAIFNGDIDQNVKYYLEKIE